MKGVAIKKYLSPFPTILVMILFVLIITYPEQAFHSALSGLNVFLNSVFPALLPFFIVSDLMVGLGIIDFLSVILSPLMWPLFRCSGQASFVWIVSVSSGYPAGARLVSMLRQNRKIDVIEAQRILSFCSTSGPLFILGAVAVGMLGSLEGGTVILVSHYLASIIIGLIFRFYKSEDQYIHYPKSQRSLSKLIKGSIKSQKKPFGLLMGDAVNSAISTLLVVGGFIVLFAVVINLLIELGFIGSMANIFLKLSKPLFKLDLRLIEGVIGGLFEITIGSRLICQSLASLEEKVVALSFIIGWSGLSINAQAIALLSKSGIKFGLYMLIKLFHGLLAAIISYLVIKIFYSESALVFKDNRAFPISWQESLYDSLQLVLFVAIFLLILLTIFYFINRVSKAGHYK